MRYTGILGDGTNRIDVIGICDFSAVAFLFLTLLNTSRNPTFLFHQRDLEQVQDDFIVGDLRVLIGKMKGFNFTMVTASALARAVPRATSMRGAWTCRQCLLESRGGRIGNQVRGYARRNNAYGNGSCKSAKPKRRGRILVAAAGGALGVTAVAFTDDLKHAYEAVERTGRVVSTLAVCINE